MLTNSFTGVNPEKRIIILEKNYPLEKTVYYDGLGPAGTDTYNRYRRS